MNKYEKLKEVCDKIGYYMYLVGNEMHINSLYGNGITKINRDIREIIFTQPFMDKFRVAMIERGYQETGYEFHMMQLTTRYLKDPVTYLDNLLKDE